MADKAKTTEKITAQDAKFLAAFTASKAASSARARVFTIEDTILIEKIEIKALVKEGDWDNAKMCIEYLGKRVPLFDQTVTSGYVKIVRMLAGKDVPAYSIRKGIDDKILAVAL